MCCSIIGESIISPLGMTPAEVFEAAERGDSSLREYHAPWLSHPVYTSAFSDAQWQYIDKQCPGADWSRFEKILYLAGRQSISGAGISISPQDTLFVVASTKGSIDEIAVHDGAENLQLPVSVSKVVKALGGEKYIIISSACISGLAAIITAARELKRQPHYRQAVVLGADTLSRFVLSGFHALQALSSRPCRPFDAARNGINLGEAAAALILQPSADNRPGIYYCGGSVTNDANHVSAPSRTGEELAKAIELALQEAGIPAGSIDFVSAHGTATIYNDEMESKALHIAQLSDAPTHSLKGYIGHTLGAAGLVETILCAQMLRNNTILPTLNYAAPGTPYPPNILTEKVQQPLSSCLKTMAGFGGLNAALCIAMREV